MTDIEKSEHSLPQKPKRFFGVRHVQFLLLFFACVLAYGMRTNLSIGILSMLQDEDRDGIPTFPEWEKKKNQILSSFFWGYVIPQIGAGEVAKRFGPKWFLVGTMAICSLFSVLLPVFAINVGYEGVMVCRVIQGLNQGFLFPSVHHLIGKWSATSETSKVAAFVYTGSQLGTVISMPVTGQIADSSVGWPTAFYLYGGLGLVWAIVFAFMGRDSPSDHPLISTDEKAFIEFGKSNEEHKKVATPWVAIVTSLPMWAVLLSHCGQNWGFWTLLTEIPSYMKSILGYDVSDTSSLSAYSYLTLWILSLIMGPIADYLITSGKVSKGATRKIFNSIGLFIPAIALVGLGFTTNKTLAVALLIIAVGFNAGVFCGFNVNHIDLSPTHSGTLMGITNCLSNIFSIIAPLTVDAYGLDEKDPILWRYVFCVAAGIYCATGSFFIFAASGEVQYWDKDPNEKS